MGKSVFIVDTQIGKKADIDIKRSKFPQRVTHVEVSLIE